MSEPWSTFGFTEEQRLMRESALDLLARVLPRDKIRGLDEKGEFPADAYAAMAQAGSSITAATRPRLAASSSSRWPASWKRKCSTRPGTGASASSSANPPDCRYQSCQPW